MRRFTEGYFSRVWADLRQDKRWWQPMLILSLVQFIPIIGSFIATGYMYDWAKEASWGLRRPFTRKMGDVGRRLKYGFFAFIIGLVWVLPVYIVGGLLNIIPFVGPLLYFAAQIISIIAAVVANVAILRALTYEHISPGLQIGRILKMAQKDSGGLVRCFLISLVGSLIVALAACIIIVPIILSAGVTLGAGAYDMYNYGAYGDMSYSQSYNAIAPMITALFAAAPILIIVLIALNFVVTVVNALAIRAYGYWMWQFEPERWGRSEEPMPFERETLGNPYGAPYTGPQPGAAQYQQAAKTPEQQAREQELYEEAKRATDAGSRAAEWDQEFAESQKAAGATAGTAAAGAAGAALLADQTPQDAQPQSEQATPVAEEAPQSWIPQEVTSADVAQTEAVAEEPAVFAEPLAADEPAAADEEQASQGWRSASNAVAAVEEPVVADEPVVETVGEIVAEESVGMPDSAEALGVVDEPASQQGWRSASNAVAAAAEPATDAAAEQKPASQGWRSASNASFEE